MSKMLPATAWTLAFDQIPVAGLVLELDGTVLAVNDAACRIVGTAASALVGRPVADLMPPAEGPDALLDTTQRQRESVHELQVMSATGPRTLECVVSVIEQAGRSVVQLFGIDITARKQAAESATARADAEESASAKQRLESLGIVAGGIAHDFNNLLVGVLAEASAAREDLSLSENTREALRRIEGAARRMGQLTRQMLAYAGRGQIVTARVDPDELLTELSEPLARIVRPEVKLAVVPGAGAVVIEADASLMRQVVINLAVNASDSGATNIDITSRIVLRQGASWWELEVADDGVGIDSMTLPRIFEPFFSTKTDRHGLGLSAVHGIVRRLGGDIEVDSKPGQGARFRVRAPVLAGAEPPLRPSTELLVPIAKLTGLRILVADDEPSVRATVRRLLERRGAIVVVAPDGSEAEARLREEQFSLVVLDVSMPGRGGYDVLATARVTQPNVPVILMSGYTERMRGEGGDEEPDAFIEKPFTAKALDAAIDEVLKGLR
jgi:PAS domain S-box-containing protein